MQEKTKRNVQLGRKLSYLLRHGAIKEGLPIKANGFVAVDVLLSKSLKGYTFRDIEEVVQHNDKQRYTLSTNNSVLEIKANQGHSIQAVCNLKLRKIVCIDFDIIHGTYIAHWHKIKSEGLSRMTRNHIHFAKGHNFTSGLRKTAEVFIYINFERAKHDGLEFYESDNSVILCSGNQQGFIEPKYFSKVLTKSGETLNF